jgi:GST-like protein
VIDLHTVPTANGQRASIMLEEVGLPYTVHVIDFKKQQHLSKEFLAINPCGMAPAIVDRDGPGGRPYAVFETMAIAYYLAEKTGKLMPKDLRARSEVYKWSAVVIADIAAAFSGQFYFKVAAPDKNAYAINLWEGRAKRFLGVLDRVLGDQPFVAGSDYTVADVLAYPTATSSAARLDDNIKEFPNLRRWVDKVGARPAVQRGMKVPA